LPPEIEQNNIPSAQDLEQLAKTRRRRGVILWLLATILVSSCAYRIIRHCYYVAQPLTLNNDLAETLKCKINPNTATWASLARLPGIGPTKAKSIIKYRKETKKTDDNIVFKNINDLQNIKGIGPITIQNIKEYITFE